MALNEISVKDFVRLIQGPIRTKGLKQTEDWRLYPRRHPSDERGIWLVGIAGGRRETFVKYYKELDNRTYNITIRVTNQRKPTEDDVFFFKGKSRILAIPSEIYRPAISKLRFQSATVKIESEPQKAEIWIDGKDTNKRTPETLLLMPGERSIILRRKGFRDAQIRVRLVDGKRYELFRKLEEEG